MINPLALESIVHSDLLPFERPFVLAHEWAHLAGHGDEAEASAVGWFACMNGPPALAYSASLYLIIGRWQPASRRARSRAFANLDAGVRADLEAIRQRLLRQQPQIRQASSKVLRPVSQSQPRRRRDGQLQSCGQRDPVGAVEGGFEEL